MHLAAESIPVAEKRGAVNASIALKMSLYIVYHIPHPGDRARDGATVIICNSISHYELIHHQNVKFQATNVKVNVKPWPLIVSAVY
jgi:hypothetical protein